MSWMVFWELLRPQGLTWLAGWVLQKTFLQVIHTRNIAGDLWLILKISALLLPPCKLYCECEVSGIKSNSCIKTSLGPPDVDFGLNCDWQTDETSTLYSSSRHRVSQVIALNCRAHCLGDCNKMASLWWSILLDCVQTSPGSHSCGQRVRRPGDNQGYTENNST